MTLKQFSRKAAYEAVRALSLVGAIVAIGQAQMNWKVIPKDTLLSEQPDLKAVAFGNNTFVGISFNKEIWSMDGSAWNLREEELGDLLSDVLFFKDKFIVAGFLTTYTSADGVRWDVGEEFSNVISQMACNDSIVVATLNYGGVFTSSDGIAWKSDTLDSKFNNFAITYGNGTFLMSFSEDSIYISKDGLEWTKKKLNVQALFSSIAFGKGMFIALAQTGEIIDENDEIIGYIVKTFKSPDGITWSAVDVDTMLNFKNVKFINNQFILVGNGIFYSSDGDSWTKATGVPDSVFSPIYETFKPTQINSVTYGNNKYIAVGEYISLVSDGGVSGIHDKSTLQNNIRTPFCISHMGNSISIVHPTRNGHRQMRFDLFDISGKRIISKHLLTNTQYTTILSGHLNAGSYMATVSENGALLESKTLCITR